MDSFMTPYTLYTFKTGKPIGGKEKWALDKKLSIFAYIEMKSKDTQAELKIINNYSFNGKMYTRLKIDLKEEVCLVKFDGEYYQIQLIEAYKTPTLSISHYVYGLTFVSKREYEERFVYL